MKKISLMLCALFLLLTAHAYAIQYDLIEMENESGHIVYDTALGLSWVWDEYMFYGLTYEQQIDSIAGLNDPGGEYFGLTGWHMATLEEYYQSLTADPSSRSVSPTVYSGFPFGRGRLDTSAGTVYWGPNNSGPGHVAPSLEQCDSNGRLFFLADQVSGVLDSGSFENGDPWGAYVVTNMQHSVPEASVMFLLGPSLMGLAVFSRKPKRS